MLLPVSAIVPTKDRAPLLHRLLQSLADQDVHPSEVVVCDASSADASHQVIAQQTALPALGVNLRYLRAAQPGLAPQRNQAIEASTQPFVWFLDDDLILQPGCLQHLFNALTASAQRGGVTPTLDNDPYTPPGKSTLALMRWLDGGLSRTTYSGRCIGPGWTFHCDPQSASPVTPVDWLIGCCSLYRREALPQPAVPPHFEAGALGEDLAASLAAGLQWELCHVRDAHAIHDSQSGDHKRSLLRYADQQLRNRWFIMEHTVGLETPQALLDLIVMQAFHWCAIAARPQQWSKLPALSAGWLLAVVKLLINPAPPAWPRQAPAAPPSALDRHVISQ